MSNERNEEAVTELHSEMAKFGLKPEAETNPTKDKAEEKEEEEKSEEETKDTPKKEEEKEDKPKDETPRPKKYIPLHQYQAEKAENTKKFAELEATIEELKAGKGTEKSKSEEINTNVKEFAQSLGVEDPEVLEKILTFVGQNTSKGMAELEKKINELSEIKKTADHEAQLKAEVAKFEGEWTDFTKSPDFTEAYPNASAEQIAEAKSMMDELSHSQEWHKYDLNYIFFKNKKDFDDSVGVKKFKGSGASKTQGITSNKKSNERPVLSDNPTASEIKEYEKYVGGLYNKGVLAENANQDL